MLGWPRALTLWSLGAKAVLGGDFSFLWIVYRLVVKSFLFL